MAVDNVGQEYVTRELGVQIFEPTGRPCGVLLRPDVGWAITTCVFSGADHSTLGIINSRMIDRRILTVEKKWK